MLRVGLGGISGTNILSVGPGVSVGGGGGGGFAWGNLAADSSDSDLLVGYDAVVAVYDGATYQYYGQAGATWKMLWVDTTGALLRGDEAGTTPVTVASSAPSGPFATSYGIATDRLAGSVSDGQTFSHEADCVLEWTVDMLPSTVVRIDFRQQDANNFWRVFIDSSGNFGLAEFVGGGGTVRGTASGVVSAGHRIVIVCDGTTIRGYSNNVLRWTYSSATNFATAAAGQLEQLGTGGAISDLIAWPRTLSGAAKDWLDAAVA